MKKTALISGMVFISFLLISQGLLAQRYYRNDPRIEDDYYDLNLTREQIEKMNRLEFELEKELSPLFLKLRSAYIELDEFEAQRSPDPIKIEKIWDKIYKLEDEIREKEISHEENIRGLLTKDQRVLFDSYYGYDRGYFGRGCGRFGYGNYGYGRYSYGAVTGRNYWGRGYGNRGRGNWGRGNYGHGRGISRGYGRGYFGRGAGRLGPDNYRYYQRFRYGRGPCGAGLGRWWRWH
jgi:hypothetical protein